MESTCALLHGLMVRQREMHARVSQLQVEEGAVDDLTSLDKEIVGTIEHPGQRDLGEEKHGSFNRDMAWNSFAPTPDVVDQTFFYAMMWGVGGGLTGDPALAFDVFIRDLVQVSDHDIEVVW